MLIHEWIDPTGASESAEPLELPESVFIGSYYETVGDFLRYDDVGSLGRTFQRDSLFLREVPGLDISIGIDLKHPASEMLRGRFYADDAAIVVKLASDYQPPEFVPGRKVGLDGIAVVLGDSWKSV